MLTQFTRASPPNWLSSRPASSSARYRAKFSAEGRQGVVRLKIPREGQCKFQDHVRGECVFEWSREQDHVIQRADGTCLYHLASVVDDFDFKISHVIRAEEHLSNTPRQIFILQGLGYPQPEYAHLPFVAEPVRGRGELVHDGSLAYVRTSAASIERR